MSSQNTVRLPWVPVSSHLIFLSPPSHITPASTSLVLGLKSCDPKCWDHLCVSSVPLSISCSPGWPWTHIDPSPSVSRVLGLRLWATTVLPLWLTRSLALHSELQASFIFEITNKISVQVLGASGPGVGMVGPLCTPSLAPSKPSFVSDCGTLGHLYRTSYLDQLWTSDYLHWHAGSWRKQKDEVCQCNRIWYFSPSKRLELCLDITVILH